ncbi:hypothetical protein GETHLI_21370 [Geothrix limicola]|uniref:Uncharacterized protein n=1 Tax=Geothrix limicola TaxID=2927978 RepID=A0ABQ5QGX9_9BACT|nr:hypothetical protein [Geothrix limicola]GLH73635.1 hypothetical protein GETHLI_21370 [Geothrix limicola]
MSFPVTKVSLTSAPFGGREGFRTAFCTTGTIGITTNHLAVRGT